MVDLMRMTNTLNLHCTLFGSGLVYTGDKTIYTEEDTPNLQSKVYPKWRVELEKHVPHYKNVLYLRILYPVTLDGHPKCFMTKMVGRAASVNNTKVSITVVPELFYFLSELSEKKKTGVLNFVNKNTILLKDLLEIYSKYKDPLTITLNNQIEKVTGYELSTDKLSLNTTSKICDIKESIISYYLKGVCT
jgi:hypothetical protein